MQKEKLVDKKKITHLEEDSHKTTNRRTERWQSGSIVKLRYQKDMKRLIEYHTTYTAVGRFNKEREGWQYNVTME